MVWLVEDWMFEDEDGVGESERKRGVRRWI